MCRLAPAVIVLLAAVASATPVPKNALPPLGKTNSNALVRQHKDKLVVTASTEYDGWPATKLVDGSDDTSWFSADGDHPTANGKPAVKVAFPAAVSVRRVTVRGNREPQYPDGYSATEGTIELLGAGDKVLASKDVKATGERHDFEFAPAAGASGVLAVRFTVTAAQTTYRCVAISELQVE